MRHSSFYSAPAMAAWIVAGGLSGLLSGADGVSPAAALSDQEKEQFLLRAKVVKSKGISVGINQTKRLTLTDGRITQDAHLNTVDVAKPAMQLTSGVEINFRDCYKFNIAAYKLDRLLNLNMIPVSVERRVLGQTGSVTWWVDSQMMEKDRYQKKITPPDNEDWNDQMYQVRIFQELVYNTDANLGNLLITADWELRMVDFTRAFRMHKQLREPRNLVRIDRRVYEGLRGLKEETLARELKPWLNKMEIAGILARRDKILERFAELIAEKGEAAVVCGLPKH